MLSFELVANVLLNKYILKIYLFCISFAGNIHIFFMLYALDFFY